MNSNYDSIDLVGETITRTNNGNSESELGSSSPAPSPSFSESFLNLFSTLSRSSSTENLKSNSNMNSSPIAPPPVAQILPTRIRSMVPPQITVESFDSSDDEEEAFSEDEFCNATRNNFVFELAMSETENSDSATITNREGGVGSRRRSRKLTKSSASASSSCSIEDDNEVEDLDDPSVDIDISMNVGSSSNMLSTKSFVLMRANSAPITDRESVVCPGDIDLVGLDSPASLCGESRTNNSTLIDTNTLAINDNNPEKPRRRNTIADIFRWLIESDSKSFNSLQGLNNSHPSSTSINGQHSRKSSDTSEISINSGQGPGGAPSDTEEDLWITWGKIVNEWDTYWRRKSGVLVRELIGRGGIPTHFRGIVWQLLCGAHDSPDKAKYADYIKSSSACEKVIRRDIARTYPEHEFFKEKDGLGQESLFNVMKAYSLHDREVGYCQGSAFIVGLLLMQMPEEEAFAVVVKLMQDYRLREMFKPSMAELGLCMYQLEMCVQEQFPELYAHFTSQGFHTSMYASSWFLTVFTTSLSLSVASRVMDLFLMDGIETIFRVALAMLFLAHADLLFLDMEGMLKFLQKELPLRIETNPEILFTAAKEIRYNGKKMKKIEKEYAAMKIKEQEEMVELRRLRTENKILKQRIEVLEAESSELANKLIQGQVGRAEEVETSFSLKRELAGVRQHYLETMKQLENVTQQYQNLLLVLDETNSTKQTSMDEISLKSELLKQNEELVHCLQNELVEVRLKEAENAVVMSDLRTKIQELEEDKKKLRESVVSDSVAHLQEELIAVKLREAEASLSLKDLRSRVAELNEQFNIYVQDHDELCSSNGDNQSESSSYVGPTTSSLQNTLGNLLFNSNNRDELRRLEEEVMSLKLREMNFAIELKEHKLRIMELETTVQVTTNQLRRQEDENKKIKDELESNLTTIKVSQSKLKEERRRYSDLESQLKENTIYSRIREAEKSQKMFDLSQQISNLKLKNSELIAEKELYRAEETEMDGISGSGDESQMAEIPLRLEQSTSVKSVINGVSAHKED